MTTWRDGDAVHAWLTQHPEHEAWVAAQDQIWTVMGEYRDAGYTAAQAAIYLGQTPEIEPESEEIAELKEQLQRQHDAIERQANTITQLQEQAKRVDFNDLPSRQQRELYDHARRRLRRLRRRGVEPGFGE